MMAACTDPKFLRAVLLTIGEAIRSHIKALDILPGIKVLDGRIGNTSPRVHDVALCAASQGP